MMDRKVAVKEVRDLGARNFLLRLHSPEQARVAQPGQFLMLKCVSAVDGHPILRRPFSILDTYRHSRSGRPIGLDMLIKDVGKGTHALTGLRPGEEIYALGPQGRPFHTAWGMKDRVRGAYLLAGGVGIAALHLLARRLVEMQIPTLLLYGGRSADDLVLRDYFEHLKMEVVCVTEDGSLGERGLVTAQLERLLGSRPRAGLRIYACGPWAMMKAVHELAVRFDLPCEVSLEARMGCSLGACMGCVIRAYDGKGEEQYLRVCQDGPVMESRIVDWETPPM